MAQDPPPPRTKNYPLQNATGAEPESELEGSNRKVEMILKKVEILEVTYLKQNINYNYELF